MSSASAEEYLKQKNLHELFQSLLTSLSVDKPDNVADYIVEKLKALKVESGSAAPEADYTSLWTNVPVQPPDLILGLNAAFKADPSPEKIALGVGAYRDENGNPWVLPSVREAQSRLVTKGIDHEYGPIAGTPQFVSLAQQLSLGSDHPLIKSGQVASIQALSGTGALRVVGVYYDRFLPKSVNKTIYIPTPTWPNHKQIFNDCGFKVAQYRYYNPKTYGLDYAGLLEDVKNAADRSVFLFHACAHNPTGVDPTLEEWKGISDAVKAKSHVVIFDCAYQGFASGDPMRDSASYRLFIEEGHQVAVCQSFAKNMGLYGQRVGAVHLTCSNPKEREAVVSQLMLVARAMYSNPPIYGAQIATEVLGDPTLRAMWENELRIMSDRIQSMRHALVEELKNAGSTRDWSHIVKQIGMFCFTGLSEQQVDRLREEFHIYMTRDGRVSLAGLTPSNVKRVAESIHEVSK